MYFVLFSCVAEVMMDDDDIRTGTFSTVFFFFFSYEIPI